MTAAYAAGDRAQRHGDAAGRDPRRRLRVPRAVDRLADAAGRQRRITDRAGLSAAGSARARRRRPRRTSPSATSRSRWPSTSDSVRNACVTATLAHIELGQLVGAPRPVLQQPRRSCARGGRAAAAARRSAPTWSVTGGPWPPSTSRSSSVAGRPQRVDVGLERLRPLADPAGGAVQRPRDQRVGRDPRQQVVAADHDPRVARRAGSRPRGCGRAGAARSASGRRARAPSPSCSGRSTSPLEPNARNAAVPTLERGREVLGHAVAAHQRHRERVVGRRRGREVAQVAGRARARRRRARPSGARGSPPARGDPCAGG